MLDIINNLDLNILHFIRDNFSNSFMDELMIFITKLGDKGFIWILIGLILIAQKKYRKIGFVLLIALLITSIIGEGILKNIVQRARAFITYPDIKLLITPPTSFSFPSGHTASSFTAAVVLGYYFKSWKFLFYILASLIAFSRLYLFVHYPSDVIAGIILGIISGFLTIKVINNMKKNKQIRKS